MILPLINEDTKLEILNTEINNISLEGGFIQAVTGPIFTAFNNTSENLKEKKNFLLDFLESRGTLGLIKEVNKKRPKTRKIADGVNYRLIDTIRVQTISGMTTRLNSVVKMNKKALKNIVDNYDNNMDKVDTRLAMFIGDVEVRKSFRTPSDNLKNIDTFIKDVKNDLKENFDAKEVRDLRELKDIIGNNKEYIEVFDDLLEINNFITDKFLIKMKKRTNVLSERIDVIHDIIESKELIISKETLKGLIESVNTISEYISVISGVYYSHVKSLEVALKIDEIYRRFKDKK